MLALRTRVDLGEMAMKGYSIFSRALGVSRTLVGVGSYLSAEMQLVYFISPTDWAIS